jgi:Spy/CpxP family protein refolding chaperone
VSTARTTLIAVIVLVLTFASGVVVGIGVARFGHFPRGPRGARPPFAAHVMLQRLDAHLDLTDAQEAQIREIFERRHARVRAEIETTNAEIERVLTPEQRRKFERFRMHVPGRRAR